GSQVREQELERRLGPAARCDSEPRSPAGETRCRRRQPCLPAALSSARCPVPQKPVPLQRECDPRPLPLQGSPSTPGWRPGPLCLFVPSPELPPDEPLGFYPATP